MGEVYRAKDLRLGREIAIIRGMERSDAPILTVLQCDKPGVKGTRRLRSVRKPMVGSWSHG